MSGRRLNQAVFLFRLAPRVPDPKIVNVAPRPPRLDPEALALEGVGRQRHSPAPLAAPHPLPFQLHAADPKLARRPHQLLFVRDALLLGAQARHHLDASRPHAAARPRLLLPFELRLLARQAAQDSARPDFQQHPLFILQQLTQPVAETHRLPHVPYPVVGARRLVRFDPLPRHV